MAMLTSNIIKAVDHSFTNDIEDEIIQAEISSDVRFLALLTANGTLYIKHFKPKTISPSAVCHRFPDILRFIWENDKLSITGYFDCEKLAVIQKNRDVAIYTIALRDGLKIESIITIPLRSLIEAFSSFDIVYEDTCDVVLVAFSRRDVVNLAINEKTFTGIQIRGQDDFSVISNCDMNLKHGLYDVHMTRSVLYTLSDDNSIIYGYSLLTAVKIQSFQIQVTHISHDISLFRISSDLQTSFLASESCDIHVCPTKMIDDKSEVEIFSEASQSNASKTLDLFHKDLPIKAMYMSHEILIVLQCDVENEIVSYFDIETLKLDSCNSFMKDSILVTALHKTHPPVMLTNESVLFLPRKGIDSETIHKLMIHGDISSAEYLSRLNNMDYIEMPIIELKNGLTTHKLDTVSYFLLKHQEAMSKQLTSISHDNSSEVSFEIEKSLQKLIDRNNELMTLLIDDVTENCIDGNAVLFTGKVVKLILETIVSIAFKIHKLFDICEGQIYGDLIMKIYNQCDEQIIRVRTLQKNYWKSDEPISEEESEEEDELLPIDREVEQLASEVSNPEELVLRSLEDNNLPTGMEVFFKKFPNVPSKNEFIEEIAVQLVIKYLKEEKLDDSIRIMMNAGMEPRKKLKEIFFNSYDSELRLFLEKELRVWNMLSSEDLRLVEFMHKIENSYPAHQFSPMCIATNPGSELFNKLVNDESDLDIQSHSNKDYANLNLNLVKGFGEEICDMILIEKVIRNSGMSALKDINGVALWRYLLLCNKIDLLLTWIRLCGNGAYKNKDDFPFGHTINEEMVDLLILHKTHSIKEILLDELAKYGKFNREERNNFVLILSRISKFSGLKKVNEIFSNEFSDMSVSDFHKSLIIHCIKMSLSSFLWTYLNFYSIDPLEMETQFHSSEWKLFSDLYSWNIKHDSSLFVKASLENITHLIDSDTIQENTNFPSSLFVPLLSSIICVPQQFRRVMDGGDFSGPLNFSSNIFQTLAKSFDPWQRYLYKNNVTEKNSLSLYDLLKKGSYLNPKLLFGWQSNNALKVDDHFPDLPHFSHPVLMEKYGHKEELSIYYYLKHGRPCFAFAKFLSQNLNLTGSVSKRRVDCACDIAHRLAFEYFFDESIASACVAFVELLGHSSTYLRINLQAANEILQWKKSLNILNDEFQYHNDLILIRDFLKEIPSTSGNLLEKLEEAVVCDLNSQNISRASVDALLKWDMVFMYCECHKINKSTVFLRHCAEENNWLLFLVVAQIYQYPKEVILLLLNHFSSHHLKEHIRNTIRYIQTHKRSMRVQPSSEIRSARDKLYDKIGLISSPNAPTNIQGSQMKIADISDVKSDSFDTQSIANMSTVSSETGLISIEEEPTDFVSVILKCHKELHPWRELLNWGIEMNNPIYCVIAATYMDSRKFNCLFSWLYISHPSPEEFMFTITEANWDISNFKIILRNYLKNHYLPTLQLGFKIFYHKSPISYLINFIKNILHDHQLTISTAALKNFQSSLIEIDGEESDIMNCRRVIEELSIELINEALITCENPIMQLALLKYFSENNFILTFTEIDIPDYNLMKKVLECLSKSQVNINLGSLLSNDESSDSVFTDVINKLLDAQLHTVAIDLCKILSKPIDHIVIHQICKKLESLKATEKWNDSEFRIQFWLDAWAMSCEFHISHLSIIGFYEEQLNHAICPYESYKILQLILKCYENMEDKEAKFEELVSRLWYNKVIAEFEMPYFEGLRNSDIGNVSDFLCSKSSEKKPIYEFEDAQYHLAIERVIGQELIFGRISQALTVSSIFDYVSQDLDIVLACIKLAKGEINPENLPSRLKVITSDSVRPRHSRKVSVASLARRSLNSSSSSLLSDSDCGVPVSSDSVILPSQAEITDIICKFKAVSVDAKECCERILTYFEVSMALKISYESVISQIMSEQNLNEILRKLLISEEHDRYNLAKELIAAHKLDSSTVNDFLFVEILKCLDSFYGTPNTANIPSSSNELIFNPSDNLGSFLQIMNLTSDLSGLGKKLLMEINWTNEYSSYADCKYFSFKIELCVKSHECYTSACNMEGISRVLKVARKLTSEMEAKEEYSLIIRLLIGIGRYSEMNYVFDLLKKHDKFELLFRKGMEKIQNLKVSLLEYLKRFHPHDIDKFNMVALHFSMYREIAEMLEFTALERLEKYKHVATINIGNCKKDLQEIVQYLADAAESFLKADCLRHAANCAVQAELVSLQIYIGETKIIALNSREVIEFIRRHPNYLETQIVAKAYDNDREWSAALYNNFVKKNNEKYLSEMDNYMGINIEIVEDMEQWYTKEVVITDQLKKNMKHVVSLLDSIESQYKMAQRLNFEDLIEKLSIGDGGCYIKDLLRTGKLKRNI